MKTNNAANVTDSQIKTLRYEAGLAGDWKQVDLCGAALRGDKAARATCEQAIRAAAAMAD